MELTPEQKASIAQWNTLGEEITENAMKFFLDSWFSNIRSLLKANFALHSLEELIARMRKTYKTFTVLGSGPSLLEILRRLPAPHGALLTGPTALGSFARESLRPTILIIADSNPEMYQHLLESKLPRPQDLDIVLPVTAHPSWYGPDSIVNRSRLYFYLPYLDFMGDTNIAYNNILKALFPEVHRWIAQAGSVSNLALNVADMCCGGEEPEGGDPDKRIYVGVDCSWTKGGSTRTPLRFDPSKHSKILQDFWKVAQRERDDIIDVPWGDETLQTDLVSLGYAVNLFYLMHSWLRRPASRNRYALITCASKLYDAAAPNVKMPFVFPEHTAGVNSTPEGEDSWAYKALLGLIELSNTLMNRLRKPEDGNGKKETPVVS